jgi:hypothetical protein
MSLCILSIKCCYTIRICRYAIGYWAAGGGDARDGGGLAIILTMKLTVLPISTLYSG